MGRLTDIEFWDNLYKKRNPNPFNPKGFRYLIALKKIQLIESIGLPKKSVVEVGGGDGAHICYLARKYPNARFAVLDFSPEGCALARKRAELENVTIDVFEADLFKPPKGVINKFDCAFSLGVVEHFDDLVGTLKAMARMIKTDGIMINVIPNFESPLNAWLCRRWSMKVWQAHVPYTLTAFKDAHEQAGLQVEEFGYLGSIDFGMLSMSFIDSKKRSWLSRVTYFCLKGASKAIHFVEYNGLKLPATRLFAPYMFCMGRKVN